MLNSVETLHNYTRNIILFCHTHINLINQMHSSEYSRIIHLLKFTLLSFSTP